MKDLLKGPAAEEALRNYFLSMGYYVARGCKFTFNQFDVTDIDLFLYSKSSSFNRERINVDIKNKRTPQALERIFWAKGLQQVLKIDGSVVATTDTRPDVKEFGLQNKVNVLDGRFLTRLVKSNKAHRSRINEEEFLNELDKASLGKLGGDWKGRYERSKTRLLTSLNFDGANSWLNDIGYYYSEVSPSNSDSALWRAIYCSISQLLICVDFILKEHVADEHEQRSKMLAEGFRYGTGGRKFTTKVVKMASSLLSSIASDVELSKTLEEEVFRQVQDVKSEVLSEHFSKAGVQSSLFEVAVSFESFAFDPVLIKPELLPGAFQAIIAVIADFFEIDRKLVLR